MTRTVRHGSSPARMTNVQFPFGQVSPRQRTQFLYSIPLPNTHTTTHTHTHRGQSERERVLCGLEAYCIHLLLLLVYECAVFCFLTGPQGGDWLWALASRALVAFSCASTFFVSHRFLSFLTFSFSLCILLALFSTRTLFTVTNL